MILDQTRGNQSLQTLGPLPIIMIPLLFLHDLSQEDFPLVKRKGSEGKPWFPLKNIS
jgi:hypothetical protein